jgi:chemotaxis protein methyltransferase CheR
MARLQAVLSPSGWLVTAPIEGPRRSVFGLDELRLDGGVFYRKQAVPVLLPQPPVVVAPEAEPAPPSSTARAQLEDILSHCRAALLHDRCDAELHQLQALVHEELGQLDEARLALRRALFLDPGCVVAHLALGRLFERQGQQAQAERHTANALELLRRRASDARRTAAPSAAETIAAELLARLQDSA